MIKFKAQLQYLLRDVAVTYPVDVMGVDDVAFYADLTYGADEKKKENNFLDGMMENDDDDATVGLELTEKRTVDCSMNLFVANDDYYDDNQYHQIVCSLLHGSVSVEQKLRLVLGHVIESRLHHHSHRTAA